MVSDVIHKSELAPFDLCALFGVGGDHWRRLYGCVGSPRDNGLPRPQHLQHGPGHDFLHGGALRPVHRGTHADPRR